MNPFSFLKQANNDRLIILDISSGSVGAAAITLRRGEAPIVDYIKRLPLPIKERVLTKTLLANTLGAIKEIASDIVREKKQTNTLAITLASPWHTSRTKVISVNKKESFTVTEGLINEMVLKEALEGNKEEKGDLTVLENRVAHLKINGYTTTNPYGKTANRLDLSLYASLAPTSFLKKVEEVMQGHFSIAHISHHSFPLVSFSAIQKIFYNDRDFVYVDVAGEVTDVAAVSDGAIVGTSSFPVGKNNLVRKVADHFKTTPDLAFSFVKLYSQGRASSDLNLQIATLSGAVKEEWLAYFHQSTSEIYTTHALPSKIFLTIDDDVSDIFLSYIPELFISKIFLSDKNLSEFCHVNKHIQHDPFLMLESIYLNSL